MSAVVRPGYGFTHDRLLDLGWTPGPGQRFVDGPKAQMVVTRVTGSTVWYAYDLGRGATAGRWRMDRGEFEGRFGDGSTR